MKSIQNLGKKMKICPQCQKSYSDDNLNFCLDDGAVLSQANVPKKDDTLPETVMMSAPRPTSPGQPLENQSPPAWGHQQQSQPSWGATPSIQAPAVKAKSKSWIWVLGILAVVVVVCGGGALGFIALVASVDTESGKNGNKAVIDLSTKSSPTSTDGNFEQIDLSKWTDTDPAYANSEFKNGEFIMGTKEKGFYYVLVASTKYQTDDSTTRLSIRNVEEKSSRLGYGLIFHSDPKPLIKDYGFLIDADKQRYRVVKHAPGSETDIIKWTKSTVIKDGTQKNVLEIRDRNGEISLYINGQKIDSIKNSEGYKGGVAGIYSGDGVPVAFSNFEIGK